ncbi:MAG: hypothetical protein AAFR96_05250 [Planctomycetota bacterium]
MAERVFLVHGWSVATTTTYRGLDRALVAQGYDATDVMLGRYVSLDDHVTIGDLANGLDRALKRLLPPAGEEYHFITHSTGALVVRDWLRRHYRPRANSAKVGNVVMLAGPQYGSRLAHLGRSMLAKIKWFGDTGDEVLRGLELGSPLQWDLADELLKKGPIGPKGDARLFCITGDSFRTGTIASRVVAASAETGSDGTVRTSAANLNLSRFRVRLSPSYRYDSDDKEDRVTYDAQVADVSMSEPSHFLVLPSYYHSDDRTSGNRGIMRSITSNATPETSDSLAAIVACLAVKTPTAYKKLTREDAKATEGHFQPSGFAHTEKAAKAADKAQHADRGKRNRKIFSQLQFRFRTDTGEPVNDFRFEMIATKNGERLHTRTIAHVHVNKRHPNHVTFFLDHNHFEPDLVYTFVFAVRQPTSLLHDIEASLDFDADSLKSAVARNRTTQIDVVLERATLVAYSPDSPGAVGFFPSDDAARHMTFDRHGRAKKKGLSEDKM